MLDKAIVSAIVLLIFCKFFLVGPEYFMKFNQQTVADAMEYWEYKNNNNLYKINQGKKSVHLNVRSDRAVFLADALHDIKILVKNYHNMKIN